MSQQPSMWTCKYCGKDTSDVDYDYLHGYNHLGCALETEMKTKEDEFDHCVLCGVETIYKHNTHVDMRLGYIEGAGQLCPKCYEAGTYRNHILVPEWLVENNPNNQELGAKVRALYFESKK
jgi:hypothetical protein